MEEHRITDGFDRGDCRLTFGDNVVVRDTPETQSAGIAGAAAQVMGETTPSDTGVTVIGRPKRDYAIALSVQERDVWIDPDLVEFVDHGAGTTFELQGVAKTWTRDDHGQWKESRLGIIQRLKRWLGRSSS